MSSVYEAIGRLVVAYLRARFRSQIRVVAALGAVGAGVAAYLIAARDLEEG